MLSCKSYEHKQPGVVWNYVKPKMCFLSCASEVQM